MPPTRSAGVCSGKPVFHFQAANAFEFTNFCSHDRSNGGAGVRGDQQAVCADRFCRNFQFRADFSIFDVCGNIERQNVDLSEQILNGLAQAF